MSTETTPQAPSRAERRAAAAAARKTKSGTEGEKPPETEPRRTYVVFVYDDEEGFERHDRLWLTGLADLRTLHSVLSAEQLIAEQKKVANVRIINWKPLEG